MSNLFNQISKEAERQKQQLEQFPVPAQPQPQPEMRQTEAATPLPQPSTPPKPVKANKAPNQSGTTAPPSGTTGPLIAKDKLATVMRELSALPTNNNGLNVRLSEQEAQDIEELIHETLRKRGLRGNHVSAAKLMRYAFRYLTRVHEREFIAALEAAFKVEDKLSI